MLSKAHSFKTAVMSPVVNDSASKNTVAALGITYFKLKNAYEVFIKSDGFEKP